MFVISRKSLKNIGFSTLVAAVFLLVATKSSPIYPLNDWVDANAIFTVGKSMMDGKVVYKDIFEQKGPGLYLIHGIGSLISHNTFTGMFFLEILAFSCFLFYSRKIMVLYVSSNAAIIGTILTAFLMVYITNFVHGNSSEQYCIPLLGMSLYYLLRYLKDSNKKIMPLHLLLWNGFLAGCVVWIKYSMIGYWFGWMIVVLYSLLIIKNYGYLIKASFVFLLGMLLSGLPWLAYFLYVDGFTNFIDVYFITNIKYYSDSGGLLMNLITISGKIILVYFKENILFALFFLTGFISLLFSKTIESKWLVKLGIFVPFLFLFLSVYGGGIRLDYYFQIVTPFVLFGVIFSIKWFDGSIIKLNLKKMQLLIGSMLTVLFAVLYFTHHNSYLLKLEKKDLFQFKFAEYINRTPNATLLNYGFLDMGVYNTANIEPNVYYFMKHNFDYDVYPFDVDAQNSYLKDKKTDFVVVRAHSKIEYKNNYLDRNYQKVMSQEQYYEDKIHNYILYKKK